MLCNTLFPNHKFSVLVFMGVLRFVYLVTFRKGHFTSGWIIAQTGFEPGTLRTKRQALINSVYQRLMISHYHQFAYKYHFGQQHCGTI